MIWRELYLCLNRLKNNQFSLKIGIVIFFFSALILILFKPPGVLGNSGKSLKFADGIYLSEVDQFTYHPVVTFTTIPFSPDYGQLRMFGNYAYVANDTVPNPSSVMRKSLILPGWGQVVNRQVWKVPIIYGMLAGLTYYSILLDQNYRDYRAAFYNSQSINGDERFGPTPPHIDPNQNPESLRYARNHYRNRRDLTFVGIILAYGLNVVDAYVFAHMRDFDVSDDLSARFYLEPAVTHWRSASTGISHTLPVEPDGIIFRLKLNLP